MAELPPTVSSSPDVASIANLGFQLATKLDLYEFGIKAYDSDIGDLGADVLGTAASLSQLQEFLAVDSDEIFPVYKDAGREAIEDLAVRCGKVYTTIIRTVYRASLALEPAQNIDYKNVSLKDLNNSRLRAISANVSWIMIEDVIEMCTKQLRWLRVSLLLHIQVASLAGLQIKSPRAPGSFDEELASRAMATHILARKLKYARGIVEDAERKARLALSDKSDTESVSSCATSPLIKSKTDDDAASWKSGKTAKDSKAPSTCEDKTGDEKKKAPPVMEPGAPHIPLPPSVPASMWHQPIEKLGMVRNPSSLEVKMVCPRHRFPVKVFKNMGKWLRGLFDSGDIPDLDNLELEATVLRHGPYRDSAVVLAFNPKMVRRDLKRVISRHSSASVESILAQDNQLRFAVNKALLLAQKKDGRARQLITVDFSTQPDAAVVFMSVEPLLEPVHLTDLLGRKYDIPFEQCQTLQGARASIHQRFKDVQRLWNLVKDGVFEIVTEDGTVITPETWNATIKPGAVLQMRIAAFNDGAPTGPSAIHLAHGAPETLSWAEPYSPPVFRGLRPPGMGCIGPPMPRPPGMPMPPPYPIAPVRGPVFVKTEERGKLGFDPEFGPELTRDDIPKGGHKDLGRWVAMWTNATDTDFSTDSGVSPSYDTDSIISGYSSSSSSDFITD